MLISTFLAICCFTVLVFGRDSHHSWSHEFPYVIWRYGRKKTDWRSIQLHYKDVFQFTYSQRVSFYRLPSNKKNISFYFVSFFISKDRTFFAATFRRLYLSRLKTKIWTIINIYDVQKEKQPMENVCLLINYKNCRMDSSL